MATRSCDAFMENTGESMAKLTQYSSYTDAQAHASSAALWQLFDGNREYLNIAHECMTRHADGSGRTAVRIAHDDGTDEILSFDEIAAGSARFAHWLEEAGIQPGDRIAFMLEPSLPFYISLFGAMMMGAISVPLFTLFGLDGLYTHGSSDHAHHDHADSTAAQAIRSVLSGDADDVLRVF